VKRINYFVAGKEKIVVISTDTPIPEEELYQRIFLPAKAAIENAIYEKKIKIILDKRAWVWYNPFIEIGKGKM
jgi:hypothetical protein